MSPVLPREWSEQGVPDYEKILRVGLKGIIEEVDHNLSYFYRFARRK